jgi:hypothetical protein
MLLAAAGGANGPREFAFRRCASQRSKRVHAIMRIYIEFEATEKSR